MRAKGFSIDCSGFRVKVVKCWVQDFPFNVEGCRGFRLSFAGLRVEGCGFRVEI